MDVPKTETVILQKEENLKTWCPSSGENPGQMIPPAGSEEWKVQRPSCGRKWHAGSTALVDQDQP